jgi:hypothetical protein
MTTEIVPTAIVPSGQAAEHTAAPLLDGGHGLMVSTAALVLLGVVVILIMLG